METYFLWFLFRRLSIQCFFFYRMQTLQTSLAEALEICRNSRSHLHKGQRSFTTASFEILSNYRKRKIVQDLFRSLNTIRTLVFTFLWLLRIFFTSLFELYWYSVRFTITQLQTEARLIKLLNEENFSDAISLLLECQQVALTYKHFHCVAALSGKLQDTLVMAEEQLDVALGKVTNLNNFRF